MPLPSQDVKDSYTLDEVQHLIAREWAKNEIISLKAGALEFQKQLVEIGGATNAELKHLRETLQEFPTMVASQISHCRDEMRREIQKDFPDRLEAIAMEKRIEDKIGETDTTLGKQISSLDKKVDNTKNELTTDINSLRESVNRQWLKISVVVATLIGVGGLIQWLLVTSKAAQAVIGG
jgi:hypothetical protein